MTANGSKWKAITRLKWWQMLILFPSILIVVFSTGKQGFEFVYYGVMENPRSKIEQVNLQEFQRHFTEKAISKEILDIDSGKIEVAYYKSDGCTLITRRFNTGRTLMKWLPYEKEEIQFTKVDDNWLIPSAFAAEPDEVAVKSPLGYHYSDPDFIDAPVMWMQDRVNFIMRRHYADHCIGEYIVNAYNGSFCCWQWTVYRH